jgi:putative Mg2+ transporter-C (MgtC) family protein
MEDELIKVLVSLLIGTLLGLEREYKTKAAGLRTIALICVGSTLFSIMSQTIGLANPDRIASNIVTGIGFIGAGVIFKSEQSVSGLTTAATIWMAAALGMSVGGGHYVLAFTSLGIALFILLALRYLQNQINKRHQIRTYKLLYQLNKIDNLELEKVFILYKLEYRKLKEYRTVSEATCVYELSGQVKKLDEMNEYLMALNIIDSFAY